MRTISVEDCNFILTKEYDSPESIKSDSYFRLKIQAVFKLTDSAEKEHSAECEWGVHPGSEYDIKEFNTIQEMPHMLELVVKKLNNIIRYEYWAATDLLHFLES